MNAMGFRLVRVACGGLTLAAAVATAFCAAADDHLDLSGSWRFALDRGDTGVAEEWFVREWPERIRLPGALQNQGFGDEIRIDTPWTGDVNKDAWLRKPQYEPYRQPGRVKIPWMLQPERHYVGAAWYQRTIDIPREWAGRRVALSLERPHWETRVWLDGQCVGTNDSLCTAHVYDLGTAIVPGRHTLTVRVDNRLIVDVGAWSHSVTDHTQGNWNGIVGHIELRSTPPVWIDDVQVYPDPAARKARVVVTIGNATRQSGAGTLVLGETRALVHWDEKGARVERTLDLGHRSESWDEFAPALQRLDVVLDAGAGLRDSRTVTFGLREIKTRGRDFELNGRKLFLRGTLECCIFPRTGYPPTNTEEWRRIVRICQSYGLNHIRFHSWCPPEAAFVAADELGFYYQVECGVWTQPGNGKPIDDWIWRESERIVRAYGNHPSFLLLTHGNEPHGPGREAYLAKWVNHWKTKDPRRLVTSGSAYPQLPENQYHVYHACRGPRGWLGRDYRETISQFGVPIVVHEMGQWCVYPDFDELRKYTGPLQPKNLEIARDFLNESGMFDQWRDFLRASGRLQALCYKEEIEAALRTPGIGGFQLLDLHDFPGQGTALVGILNPFWDSKGYLSPQEHRRYCNPTVCLARLLKRVWTTEETLTCDLELAHFGAQPLGRTTAFWRLVTDDGRVLAGGERAFDHVPIGGGFDLGSVTAGLSDVQAPASVRLVAGLKDLPVENDWRIWVYPKTAADPTSDVIIARSPDAVFTALQKGAAVLYLPARKPAPWPRGGFEPIFWNRFMFHTQGRQTLGLLCDPRHPALAGFPTDFHADFQWQDLMNRSSGMVLDVLPRELRPFVQVIDDWNTARRLGLAFECKVGPGRLLACSADLDKDLDTRPAARQLRQSLLAYMAGPAFRPRVTVDEVALRACFEPKVETTMSRLGAKVVRADSEDAAHENIASNVVDGDADTFWHTQWQPTNAPMPHELVVDLGREVSLRGVRCLPRQDMTNGRIAQYEIAVSSDGREWKVATKGSWKNIDDWQEAAFRSPTAARFLKLIVRSEVKGNPFAAAAELDVLVTD